MKDFYETHQVFTTSDARKAGIDKSALKKDKTVVSLGAFPIPQRKNKRLETVWAKDPELASLIRQSTKLFKQGKHDDILPIRDKIESIVREKLGFTSQEDNENGSSSKKEDPKAEG